MSLVIISLPEKSSSKLALCVITQTLPVFVNFNLMDPSEIQKLWIKNIQPQFLTFCLDILIITTKVNNNYNFFYNQWTRMNLCQWKTNLNLSLTLQKPFWSHNFVFICFVSIRLNPSFSWFFLSSERSVLI